MEPDLFFPPPRTSDNAPWLNNFVVVLLPIFADYDITQAEMDELELDNTAFQFTVTRQGVYDDVNAEYINTRNIIWSGDTNNPNLAAIGFPNQPAVVAPVPASVRPNLYARLKSLVFRLRQHPKMTEVVAKQLGILPKPQSIDPSPDYQPNLGGSVYNGQAVLDCPVRGFAGYAIWRAVGGSNDFVYLDKSLGRSYTDTTPLPEGVTAQIQSYRVRMLDTNNQSSGQWSNIVTLTVSIVI
ncbi:MAG: hypothetical protein GC192_18880 [Bacteroidetes bacterium]|nr:hypothetical protein [Bacteroidota bacterium]